MRNLLKVLLLSVFLVAVGVSYADSSPPPYKGITLYEKEHQKFTKPFVEDAMKIEINKGYAEIVNIVDAVPPPNYNIKPFAGVAGNQKEKNKPPTTSLFWHYELYSLRWCS